MGVQINHTAPVNKGEIVWTIGAEEVIFIGRLFNKGVVDMTRTIALVGSEVKNPAYSKAVLGAQISNLLAGRLEDKYENRIIDGNVLTGKKTTADGFLGAFSTEVTVIPEIMNDADILGWAMPRFGMYSTSRSYFSWLCPKRKYTIDARIKGGERQSCSKFWDTLEEAARSCESEVDIVHARIPAKIKPAITMARGP